MTNIDLQTREEGMEVMALRAGLKTGVENSVDLLLRIRAPNTLSDGTRGTVIADWDSPDDLPGTFEQDQARMAGLAFRDVVLSASPAKGGTVVQIGALAPRNGTWQLPNLAWGEELLLAARILVPAAALVVVGEQMFVARFKLKANHTCAPSMAVYGLAFSMPVLAADEYDESPVDVFVSDQMRCANAG